MKRPRSKTVVNWLPIFAAMRQSVTILHTIAITQRFWLEAEIAQFTPQTSHFSPPTHKFGCCNILLLVTDFMHIFMHQNCNSTKIRPQQNTLLVVRAHQKFVSM